MTVRALLRDNRGVATSLLETVLVIAIVAVISTVALASAMGHMEDAKSSRAYADVEMIGIAIHSFMHDTGFAPAYKSGDLRGPSDEIYSVLESEGSEPGMLDESIAWPAEFIQRDRLENHLMKNLPGGEGPRYPRVGEISYARMKGWNGPYLASMPSSDPWANKYLVNIQLQTAKGVSDASETLTLEVGQRAAVFVISAGPNRLIETRFDQVADAFTAGGDDIVFRIQ